MKPPRRDRLAAGLLVAFALACAGGAEPPPPPPPPPPAPAAEPADFTRCTEPRRPMCTREYRPVCAQVDTGVRCVKAPCPSAEWKTYPNACTACADEKGIGHRPGACESP
jgi:hypothetical protein